MTADTDRVDPRWGELWGELCYDTAEHGRVWAHRKGCKVRFFDAAGVQVGPEQPNVFPAIVYAHHQGWSDPTLSRVENNRLRREVHERTRLPGRG